MYTYGLVERDPTAALGAGVFHLMRAGESIYSCDVITGGSILDPHTYGGITPPVIWSMVERIEINWVNFPAARIYPLDEVLFRSEYPRRSIALDGVPFMIHAMGRSTGCVGPAHTDWELFSYMLNHVWDSQGGLIIRIRDTAPGYFTGDG